MKILHVGHHDCQRQVKTETLILVDPDIPDLLENIINMESIAVFRQIPLNLFHGLYLWRHVRCEHGLCSSR